jgi:hypothetical protein
VILGGAIRGPLSCLQEARASASQGLTVKELRAAIGLTRERLETAYE